jgi:hypothetical protein
VVEVEKGGDHADVVGDGPDPLTVPLGDAPYHAGHEAELAAEEIVRHQHLASVEEPLVRHGVSLSGSRVPVLVFGSRSPLHCGRP